MKTYTFKIIVAQDFFEDGTPAYHAYAPALKGAATWGYTKEEAVKNIQEVIQMVVESMAEHKEPLAEEPSDLVMVSSEPRVTVMV